MNKSTLRVLAVVLTVVLVVLLAVALDRLPSSVRAQIVSERTALAAADTQIKSAQDEVTRQVQSDAALFEHIPAATLYPQRLQQAAMSLRSAQRDMDELAKLEKSGRHGDAERAQRLLSDERTIRTRALTQANDIKQDAGHWVDLKKHLPQSAAQMQADYNAIHAFDLAPLAATVQNAETDWPEKKSDLESRLAAERSLIATADQTWQSTADARRQAAAGNAAGLDYGALFGAAATLHSTAADLPKQAAEVQSLTAQLYNSWDKLLVDMDVRGIGTAREYDQKVRTVTTVHPAGTTSADEKWVTVSKGSYDAMRNNLGMAIEHKPAGKYDIEAERTAQPAGFAYIAPPGQSNQYGHWENSGGQSFWVFYGQYALMRDLLFNHSYRAPEPYDWNGYRTAQRSGQTYYGHDTDSGSAKYGSQGAETQKSYSGSSYAKSGGFRDSQYASKSGSYRDSKYSSPASRDPNADHNPKRFGSGSSRPEEPHVAPPPQRSYRPAPSRPPSRSPGRTFGRRR
jgi:hypothetical protein